jgi:glycosyltransferase involved in cell wall biosynthesis
MSDKKNKLLVLDTSYTYEDILKRGIVDSVTCRDLDGFFNHVYTVHPVATLVTSTEWTPKYGKPVVHVINDKHTFIECKAQRYKWLSWFLLLNFFLSQIHLYFYLNKLIRQQSINVIRSGDCLYLGLLGYLFSKKNKIPFLVRVGGNNDKVFETTGQPLQKRIFFARSIEKKVERFVFKKADFVAGANQDNLNFALNNGARVDKSGIFRYGNLLDANHFIAPNLRKEGASLLEKIEITPHKFLLYIGRLEKVKHPDHVVNALIYLRHNNIDVKCLFVGDGTMKQTLLDLAKQNNIENFVVFAGNQNQEWLSRIIPLCSAVMSPHTGRALSEVALAGVPVVAYDIDWQGELIENNVTGLLVKYAEQQLFNEATKIILTNSVLSKSLAENLRIKALNMLDPVKLNANEVSVYTYLIKEN